MTAPNEGVVNKYVYDAWGVTVSKLEVIANAITYTGRELNKSGLYYYRARHYQSEVGRFIQGESLMDIAAGSVWNRYIYVGNNPIIFRDYMGSQKTAYPSPNIIWENWSNCMRCAPKSGPFCEVYVIECTKAPDPISCWSEKIGGMWDWPSCRRRLQFAIGCAGGNIPPNPGHPVPLPPVVPGLPIIGRPLTPPGGVGSCWGDNNRDLLPLPPGVEDPLPPCR